MTSDGPAPAPPAPDQSGASLPAQVAARRLWWLWLPMSILAIFWILLDSSFSSARRVAYVAAAILPLFGALGALSFGAEQARKRIARSELRQIMALNIAYMVLVLGVPLLIQMRALSRQELGSPNAGGGQLQQLGGSAAGSDDAGHAAAAKGPPADRDLDLVWPLLSVFMGFIVFAHGRVIGKQQDG